jgi:cell division septum initiation protein DivIVA
MDIQHLIDRLEDLVDGGRHIPMGKYTIVDEESVLSIIDQMRISIPDQIESAVRVVNQRDKLMAQANEEASRIVTHARQKSEDMLNRDSIVVGARHQASNIVAQAQREGDQMRADADAYVVEVLRELESHLLRTLTVVRNGIAKVMQDREAAQQARASMQQHTAQQQSPDTMPIPQREEVPVERDDKS